VVYRSDIGPQDPKTTSWYQLADLGLLPETVAQSVQRHGGVHQDELVLPWLDKNLTWFGQH
jgi:hypothetical protein